VLAVTGAEALYADMGHFGRSPIRRAWFLFVFPALTLNYLGQGSLILHSPNAVANPFFLLFPDWARIPTVVLATFATVIASQAVISGAFSVTRQAMQLGFLPRLTIHHTSEREIGQVYAPAVNGMLYVAVVALVVGFGSSAALAAAYGIAVTGTLAIDTILFFVVVRALWGKPWWMVAGGLIGFLTVDLAFLGANVPKIVHGGWFPLMIGAVLFTVLTTWQRGRQLVTAQRQRDEGPLREWVTELHERRPPLPRVPGTAVFLNRGNQTAPLAMRANVRHNHVLHEHVVILSIQTQPVPRVPEAERLSLDDLGYADDGIVHVTATFGYMDEPDVPRLLRLLNESGLESPVDVDGASYFLSTIDIRPGPAATMPRWRKRLFVATSGITADAAEYFGLPRDRTVIMGSQVEV
jgi:KUP system potassium uptake protein